MQGVKTADRSLIEKEFVLDKIPDKELRQSRR